MDIQKIAYKGSTVSFFEKGSGAALVLLHGFLENKWMWEDLAAVWSEKFRVISIDLLGHGESDCLGYVHTMEDQAEMGTLIGLFFGGEFLGGGIKRLALEGNLPRIGGFKETEDSKQRRFSAARIADDDQTLAFFHA